MGRPVIVFDLDETIGYFQQLSVFIYALEDILKKKVNKQNMLELLKLYPEYFRPEIFKIFSYLLKHKKSKNAKVFIYTNNTGPKSWVYTIKKYIENKIGGELFDRMILTWKNMDGVTYEKCRTSYEKKYSDLLRCGKLSREDKILFLDDTYYPKMVNKNIVYLNLHEYKNDISYDDMINRYLKSKLSKGIKDNNLFKKELINYLKQYGEYKNVNKVYLKRDNKLILKKIKLFMKLF